MIDTKYLDILKLLKKSKLFLKMTKVNFKNKVDLVYQDKIVFLELWILDSYAKCHRNAN